MNIEVRALRTRSIAAAQALLSSGSRAQPVLLTDLSLGATQAHQILADFKAQGFDFSPREAFEHAQSSASEAMVFGLLHAKNMRKFFDDKCRSNTAILALEASAKRILNSISSGAVSEVLFVPPLQGVVLDTESEWLLWFIFSRATPLELQCLSFVVGPGEGWSFPEFLNPEFTESGFGLAKSEFEPSYILTSKHATLLSQPGFLTSAPKAADLVIPLSDATNFWVAPSLREVNSRTSVANLYARQLRATGAAFLRNHPEVSAADSEYFDIAIRKSARNWAACGGFDSTRRLLNWAVSVSQEQHRKSRFTMMMLGALVASEHFEALASYESEARRAPPHLLGEMLFLVAWGKLMSGDFENAPAQLEEAQSLIDPFSTRFGQPYLKLMLAMAYARLGKRQRSSEIYAEIALGDSLETGVPTDTTLSYFNEIGLATLSRSLSDSQPMTRHIEQAYPESRRYLYLDEAMYREGCIARALSASQSRQASKKHWLNAALHFVANPTPESINRFNLQIFLPDFRGSTLRGIDWVSAWLIETLQIESLCEGDSAQAAVFVSDSSDQFGPAVGNAEAWITPERAVIASGHFSPSSLRAFKELTRLRIGLTKYLAADVKAPYLPRTIVVPTRRQPRDEDFGDTCDRLLANYWLSAIRTKFAAVPVSGDEIAQVRRRVGWELSSQVTLWRDDANELVIEKRRFGQRTLNAQPILDLIERAKHAAGAPELSHRDRMILMMLERDNVVSMTLNKLELQDLTVESEPIKGDHSLTP